MCGVEEPLLPERRAVEDRAAQSEGAFETQEARHPRLHKTAGLRGLDVWAEISKRPCSGRASKPLHFFLGSPLCPSEYSSKTTRAVKLPSFSARLPRTPLRRSSRSGHSPKFASDFVGWHHACGG